MGSKKSKKKKSLLIPIVIVLILIILVATILVIIKKPKAQEAVNIPEEDQKVISEVKDYYMNVEGEIVPDNYNIVVRIYEGNVSSDELYRSIYLFIFTEMPTIYKELKDDSSDEAIEEYYEKNKETILLYTGAENEEEFKSLAKKILEKQYSDFKNATFTFDEPSDDDERLVVGLNIEYANGTLELKTSIINSINQEDPDIKYLAK